MKAAVQVQKDCASEPCDAWGQNVAHLQAYSSQVR